MEAEIKVTADMLNMDSDRSDGSHGYTDSEAYGYALGLDSVHVSGPGELSTNDAEKEHLGMRERCSLCGVLLHEDGNEFGAGPDAKECLENVEEETPCAFCGVTITLDDSGEWQSEHGSRIPCDGHAPGHIPEPVPCSWLNSAGVDVDIDKDEVSVSLSVSDPRGALVMKVWRGDDGLHLSLPYPGEGAPHVDLEQIMPGHFRVKDL